MVRFVRGTQPGFTLGNPMIILTEAHVTWAARRAVTAERPRVRAVIYLEICRQHDGEGEGWEPLEAAWRVGVHIQQSSLWFVLVAQLTHELL